MCWAIGALLSGGADMALARCIESGNTTLCINDDGSFKKTTRIGNTTIVNRSDGYHATTTQVGNDTYTSDSDGNFTSTFRMGDHSFATGVNANTGSSWSKSKTKDGGDTFASGAIDGQPWTQTTQRMGNTTVFSGINTDGIAWSTTRQIIGGKVIYSGTDPNGVPWPEQPQPAPVGPPPIINGIYAPPPAPLQSFCPIC